MSDHFIPRAKSEVDAWDLAPCPEDWGRYEPRRRPRLLHFDPLMVIPEPVEPPDHIPYLDEIPRGWLR